MEEAILKSVLNFGVFPAITMYLIFVIIKDFKKDIEDLKNNTINYNQQVVKEYSELNDSINKLIKVDEQIQMILTNYLNKLLEKILEEDNNG